MPSEPPTYQVRQMPGAGRDLAEIFGYLSSVAPDAAGPTLASVARAIESLARLPRRFRVYRASGRPSRVVHVAPCGRYLIYYRVEDGKRIVQILMVRHGARRPPMRFPTR